MRRQTYIFAVMILLLASVACDAQNPPQLRARIAELEEENRNLRQQIDTNSADRIQILEQSILDLEQNAVVLRNQIKALTGERDTLKTRVFNLETALAEAVAPLPVDPPVDPPDPEMEERRVETTANFNRSGEVIENVRFTSPPELRVTIGIGNVDGLTMRNVEIVNTSPLQDGTPLDVIGWDNRLEQALGARNLLLERVVTRGNGYGGPYVAGGTFVFRDCTFTGGLHGGRIAAAEHGRIERSVITGSIHGSIIRLSDIERMEIYNTTFRSPDGGSLQVGVFGDPRSELTRAGIYHLERTTVEGGFTRIGKGAREVTLIDHTTPRLLIESPDVRWVRIEGGNIGTLENPHGVEIRDGQAEAEQPPITWASPITIGKGGTYTGNWASDDPDTAAVRIRTREPVIIENSRIESRGDLIDAKQSGANVIIRNVTGHGLNPNVDGAKWGRAVNAYKTASVEVRDSSFTDTAGIYFLESTGRIHVIGNTMTNIMGLLSDGQGGWHDDDNHRKTGAVKLNVVTSPDIEIAWNRIENEPGKSRPEDTIDFYKSGGTSDSPAKVHNNLIVGAYAVDPLSTRNYSGGGIMLGDAGGDYIHVWDNVVLQTSNYGIQIRGGQGHRVWNNLVLMNSTLPDGTAIRSSSDNTRGWFGVGATRSEGDNRMWNNQVRYERADGSTNNFWFSSSGKDADGGNTVLSGAVTQARIDAAIAEWEARE